MHQLHGIKPEFSGLVVGNHVDIRWLARVSLIAVEKPVAIHAENSWHSTSRLALPRVGNGPNVLRGAMHS